MRDHKYMLRIDSDPRNVAQIESFVQRIVEKFKLCPDAYGNLLVTLTEAVNNAIIHGNQADRSKTVQVHLRKKSDRLLVRVSDEGCGFDYDNLPDPTCPENRHKLGGRGVFLMQQLSDEIRFRNNGSTVEIQFKL